MIEEEKRYIREEVVKGLGKIPQRVLSEKAIKVIKADIERSLREEYSQRFKQLEEEVKDLREELNKNK